MILGRLWNTKEFISTAKSFRIEKALQQFFNWGLISILLWAFGLIASKITCFKSRNFIRLAKLKWEGSEQSESNGNEFEIKLLN